MAGPKRDKGRRVYEQRAVYEPTGKIPWPDDPNLPEEARVHLYTIDTLPRGGGIETSMHYTGPEDHKKAMERLAAVINRGKTSRSNNHDNMHDNNMHKNKVANNNMANRVPSTGDGLQSSRWAAPSNQSRIKFQPPTVIVTAPSQEDSPKATTGNPLHERQNQITQSPTDYVPPHLRTKKESANREKSSDVVPDSSNENIPPHLRALEKKPTSKAAELATAIQPSNSDPDAAGRLASSWEEFINPKKVLPQEVPQQPKQSSDSVEANGTTSAAKPSTVSQVPQSAPEKAMEAHDDESKVPLTKDALIKKSGAAPPESLKSGASGYGVSDAGLDSPLRDVVVDPRGTLAPRPEALQDWDGSWAPPPPVWESERDGFQSDFIPAFIKSWRERVPSGERKVDLRHPNFVNGESGINNFDIIEPVVQPESHPDLMHSANASKQILQTSEAVSRKVSLRVARIHRSQQASAVEEKERLATILAKPPERNPNSPTTRAYFRPAEQKDIPGIVQIYNYYIKNSIIPEDQTEITTNEMHMLFSESRDKSFPFIVAIFGTVPATRGRTNDNEMVIGFAFAEGFYGLKGVVTGRSRFTASIKFFVHIDYTRKGIGRCLLDRILIIMSPIHGAREGYDWINPDDNPVYKDQGGGGQRRFHQLFIERPFERKEDPNYDWMKPWLERKFFFREVARFLSVTRTRSDDISRFTDLVTFQLEAAMEIEFACCV